MRRTKYFAVRWFFGLEGEEWAREWAKFSEAEKEQFTADVKAHLRSRCVKLEVQ